MASSKVSEQLTIASDQIAAAGISSSRLDAELLAAKVLGCNRAGVIARKDDYLSAEQRASFEALVKRRSNHEPVAYITGFREFYGREFTVSPAVLVPRPETELLVDLALQYLRQVTSSSQSFQVIDLGCGSGAIGLTVAVELGVPVVLTDISTDAIEVAETNAKALGVFDKVKFVESDLLAFLHGETIAGMDELVILANLPYISTSETLPKDVADFEPHSALFAGPDGLHEIGRLLLQAAPYRPKVRIFLEHGHGSRFAIKQLAQSAGFKVATYDDLAGKERVLEVW